VAEAKSQPWRTWAINTPQRGAFITSMRWLPAAAVSLLYAFAGPLSTAPAFASVEVDGVTVDPGAELRPALLKQALAAWRAHSEARRDRIAVVDFAAASSEPRLYLIDLTTGAVEKFRTAHGRGSDPAHDGRAHSFSNTPGSGASSLGAYLVGANYSGAHGQSLFLDGLDATNSNARARAIVLHSAAYMSADFVAKYGQPGRSLGCFVVAPDEMAHVARWAGGGVLLYAGA
jgi:hypothetical protein